MGFNSALKGLMFSASQEVSLMGNRFPTLTCFMTSVINFGAPTECFDECSGLPVIGGSEMQ